MAHIGRHPAPGFGELIPGSFVVPSNPIAPRGYIPHIGELLPASFTVPQNPLVAAMLTPPGSGMPDTGGGPGSGLDSGLGCGCSTGCGSGMCGSRGRGLSGLGSDCGCIGGMCGCGMGDLGQFGMDPMTLALLAGGLLLVYYMVAPGGSGYRQKKAALAGEYSSKVAALRSKERGYKRVARGATRRLAAGAAQL
jgi:hypothetical protein